MQAVKKESNETQFATILVNVTHSLSNLLYIPEMALMLSFVPVFARRAVVSGGVSQPRPPAPARVPVVGAGVGGVGASPSPGAAARVNDVGRGAAYLAPLVLQPVGGPLLSGVIAQSAGHLVTLTKS